MDALRAVWLEFEAYAITLDTRAMRRSREPVSARLRRRQNGTADTTGGAIMTASKRAASRAFGSSIAEPERVARQLAEGMKNASSGKQKRRNSTHAR